MLVPIILILICCIIIWRASDGFEAASEYLGRNLSEGVRGATINAIGSSVPELFTTLFFLFVLKDKDGFSGGIGTTAGSAIFNGMIIPAVVILAVVFAGVIKNVEVSRKVILRDGITLLLCELVLIFILGGQSLDWWHGLILMLCYVVYASYMLLSMKKVKNIEVEVAKQEEPEEEEASGNLFLNIITLNLEPVFLKNGINTVKAWSLLCVAMFFIGAACLLLVHSCEVLGETMGVPIYFIAIVLASAATSVPDTILSVRDAKKGNYDDAVSNALGSNIFDVCFALGLPLFIFCLLFGKIEMSAEAVANISELRIVLFICTLLAFIIFITKRKMSYKSAVLLLLIYVAFISFILGKANDMAFSNVISSYLESINNFINGIF